MYATLNGETKPITRMKQNEPRQAGVFWCPFCGRSHQMPAFDCRDGCGAVFRQEEPEPIVVTITQEPAYVAAQVGAINITGSTVVEDTASETITAPSPAPLNVGARLAAARAAKRQERKEQAEREAKT